jgi:hypothetical protein
MKRVSVICEGPSEEVFIEEMLAPHFATLKICLVPRMISTSPGKKGGGLNYDRVKKFLHTTLLQDKNVFVTTLFDLYGLSNQFPAYQEAQKKNELADKLKMLNDALHADIIASAKCRAERFIPYIQPYEFEALFFSDVDQLVTVERNWQKSAFVLHEIRKAVDTPEHINNSKETKPAAHLEKHLNPSYRKVRHAPLAAKKIGLPRIEQECAFFAAWLKQLRQLANPCAI